MAKRRKIQLVVTVLCAALGTSLICLIGHQRLGARSGEVGGNLFGYNPAASLLTQSEGTTDPIRACRGMRSTWLWPDVHGCEGKSNCARRIARGEGYSLPKNALDSVQYLLLFVGIGRSGSSIVGSLIDAHPNAVVANQYQLLHGFIAKPALHNTKEQVFSRLVRFAQKQAREKERNFGKGYSLTVGNGTTHIDESTQLTVIGDKGAGMFPGLYVADHEGLLEEYSKLNKTVGVPIKIVQVVRNPFDNIATEVIYHLGNPTLRLALVNGDRPPLTLSEMGGALECATNKYFTQMLAISQMETALDLDLMRLHLVDLVTKPRQYLQEICDFLHLDCTEDYLRTCEESIFSELSQTRGLIEWHSEQKIFIQAWINQMPWLQRYSFTKD